MPYRLNPRFRRFPPVGRIRSTFGHLGMGAVSVDSLASAIAQMEGYNTPGTLAQRNNNPGNLRSAPGQTGSSGGFAVFDTPAAGWAALDSQINTNVGRGLTLNEFFAGKPGVYAGYAPSADSNNPAGYASFVASQTGADPNVPLSSLLAGDSGSGTPAAAVDPLASVDPTTGLDVSSGGSGGLSSSAWLGIAAAGIGLLVWAAG
jgi:hypothetical protein